MSTCPPLAPPLSPELVQLRKIEFPPTFIERMLAAAVQIQSNQAEESLQVVIMRSWACDQLRCVPLSCCPAVGSGGEQWRVQQRAERRGTGTRSRRV